MAPRLDAERMQCQLLAGVICAGDLPPSELDAIWTHAEAAGGLELLAAALAPDRQISVVVANRAAECLRKASVVAMLRQRTLRRLVEAFDAAAVRMLLLKGAALSYTVYPAPYLRPASDIDVLISRDSLDAAESVLATLGFVRELEPDAESASMQRHYARRDACDADHFIDLHWQIANRQVFAKAFAFDDAWRRSQPVTPLGRGARALGTADALLLACIHRVAHHGDDPNLIWLWDIHMLCGAMTAEDVDLLSRRASATAMRAVTAHGLELTRQRFGTSIDPRLMAQLQQSDGREESARFIGHTARHIDLVLSDFGALPTTSARVRLLREHLFPRREYMRAKYPGCPRALLPFAYLYRAARGVPKWFQR
jgi:hypothetical protein